MSASTLLVLPISSVSAATDAAPTYTLLSTSTNLDEAYARALAQLNNLELCTDITDSEPVPSETEPEPMVAPVEPSPSSTPDAVDSEVANDAIDPEPSTSPAVDPSTSETTEPSSSPTVAPSTEPSGTPEPEVSASPEPTNSNASECVSVEAQERSTTTAVSVATEDGSTVTQAQQIVDFAQTQAGQAPQTSLRVVSLVEEAGEAPEVVVEQANSVGQAERLLTEAYNDPDTVAVTLDTEVSVNAARDRVNPSPYWFSTRTTSDDPQRSSQNYTEDLGANSIMRFAGAWNQLEYSWTKGRGDGIVVAVVDTGVDGTHPDLAGQVLPGYDFVSSPTTGPTAGWNDGNSHGTHVAGIIAAKDNNGVGITGVAPGASILPVRVLGNDGSGYASTVAAGIVAAADAGAQIINLSLGSSVGDPVLEAAVQYAQSEGSMLVAAGGNLNMRGWVTFDGESYPASYPGVLGVGSTNTDCGGIGGLHLDVSAPGCLILSTIPGGGYARYSGTSMATPQVAGEMAILMSAGLTGAQAETAILGNTLIPTWILEFDCVETPESTPTNRSYICDPIGMDVTKTRLMWGSGTIQIADAVAGGTGTVWANGSYWGAPTPVAVTAPPAAAPRPSAPNSGGGGGSSSGSVSGGGGALQEITELRPATGPLTGGNTVAVIGYGLSSVTTVTIGGKTASFKVINDAHVDVVIPPGAKAGSADVALNISSARGRAFAGGGYVYQDLPPVTVPTPSGPIVTTPETAPATDFPLTPVVQVTGERMTVSVPEGTSFIALQKRSKGKWVRVRSVPVSNGEMTVRVRTGTYRVVATTTTGKVSSAIVKVKTAR